MLIFHGYVSLPEGITFIHPETSAENPQIHRKSRVLPGGGQQPRGVAPTEAPDAGTAGELGGLAESLEISGENRLL
jgi:hypothetical protein